ncbi:MAG: hypothetical protein JWM80_3131 [Cyanobacteria bacterium RYN_339]|nr:hypothetical protein [Cyanobacteria bacterium RYN_339]
MSKIAVLNDVMEFANILAAPLKGEGHEMMCEVTSIDFERVMNFKPELIILGLHRRIDAFDRPIENIEADVFGFKPLVDMERYPAISVIPILLFTTGLKEQDIPTTVNYDSFLILPEDAALYFPKVKELIETVKTRRRISENICPNCGSRLTYTAKPENLFCPRCHAGVVIVDAERCLVTEAGEVNSKPCSMKAIRCRKGDTSNQAETRAIGRSDPA